MFGFLRPSCRQKDYRQVYASYCAFQRQRYGIFSSLFVSYEAVFLYHLAVELGACEPIDRSAPTCCRFRQDRMNRWNIDVEFAEFCAAVAMLLARVKLDDDVRDSRSLPALGVRSLLRREFKRAAKRLNDTQDGIVERVNTLVERHVDLEQTESHASLETCAAPTASAFELVFQAFGDLCSQRLNRRVNLGPMGAAIGAGLVVADCVYDADIDRKRGHFNPIRNRHEREQATQSALGHLSSAGWECCNLVGDAATATGLVRASFDRLKRLRAPVARKSSRLGRQLRRGDCDCGGCDCLCDGCGAADCCAGGGDGAGGDCFGGACGDGDCGRNGSSCCCDGCANGFDCCVLESNKTKKKQNPDVQLPTERLIGCNGIATTELKPTGVVKVNGLEWPARILNGLATSGSSVMIVDGNRFGLIVGQS